MNHAWGIPIKYPSFFNSNGMNAADCGKMVSTYKTMAYGAGRNAPKYEYATICMPLLQVAVAGRRTRICSIVLVSAPHTAHLSTIRSYVSTPQCQLLLLVTALATWHCRMVICRTDETDTATRSDCVLEIGRFVGIHSVARILPMPFLGRTPLRAGFEEPFLLRVSHIASSLFTFPQGGAHA